MDVCTNRRPLSRPPPRGRRKASPQPTPKEREKSPLGATGVVENPLNVDSAPQRGASPHSRRRADRGRVLRGRVFTSATHWSPLGAIIRTEDGRFLVGRPFLKGVTWCSSRGVRSSGSGCPCCGTCRNSAAFASMPATSRRTRKGASWWVRTSRSVDSLTPASGFNA